MSEDDFSGKNERVRPDPLEPPPTKPLESKPRARYRLNKETNIIERVDDDEEDFDFEDFDDYDEDEEEEEEEEEEDYYEDYEDCDENEEEADHQPVISTAVKNSPFVELERHFNQSRRSG